MKTTGLWSEGDNLIERRSFDAEPYIEHAMALQNAGITGSSDFRHAAHFPPGLFEVYMKHHGISFHELMANPVHVKNMLNDPGLSRFRIWRGKV